jgi:hypothetical protein
LFHKDVKGGLSEQMLADFRNRALWVAYGPKKEEVTGGWK